MSEKECAAKHWWIKAILGSIITTLLLGLTGLACTYHYAIAASTSATREAVGACKQAEEAVKQVEIHAAEAVAERRSTRGRLDAMNERQVKIGERIERVLEVVLEIKHNGRGSE